MTDSGDHAVDGMLTEAGDHWRSERPAPRPLDPAALVRAAPSHRSRMPRLLLTASGAGLAAALALVGFILADSNNGSTPVPSVGADVATTSIQPWAPLSPGPSPVVTPSAVSTSPASSLRLCRSDDVDISESPGGAGLGTGYEIIVLRNTGSTACQLSGSPTLSYESDPGAKTLGLSIVTGLDGGGPAPALLQPGEAGGFTFAAPDGGCPPTATVRPGGLLLSLPGGGSLPLPDVQGQACPVGLSEYYLVGRGANKYLPLGPVELPTPSPTPATGLDALTATMQGSGSATAGTTYDYTIRLENPTAQTITLTPCPTYDERTKSRYDKPAERYTLNCGKAPSIPAGGSLTFAMRYQVPAEIPSGGEDVLIWWVEGHDGLSGNAQLTVGGSASASASTLPPSSSTR